MGLGRNSGVAPANQTKERAETKNSYEFRPFLWILVFFFLRKTSTIHISNFCSGMPLRKVHEPTFLWFGLPGPRLRNWEVVLTGQSFSQRCVTSYWCPWGLGSGWGGWCRWFAYGPPFFVHPFFLFSPVRPTLPPGNFFPKIPSFWDLRSTLSRREKATRRDWALGTVLDGVAPQEKKENPFFLAREKRKKVRWEVKGKGEGGWGVGWGQAREFASQCARISQIYPLANLVKQD